MTTLAERVTAPSGWLASADDGVVVSSRVRLARNLADVHFRRDLDPDDQAALVERLMGVAGDVVEWGDGLVLDLQPLSATERKVLLERRLISREMVSGKRPGGVVVDADEHLALMLNEEDHVRLQAMAPGLAIEECLTRAIALDQRLEGRLDWAIHPDYGYLTSCPTNTGTGLRASCMLHLPALAETKEITPALRAIGKLHLTVRGLFGEGSEASGHYYQVSNQRTLGVTEEEIVATIAETVATLVDYEQLARATMLDKRRSQLEDRIFRAWAILTQARRLTGDELVEQLSWVRLGRACGAIEEADWATLDTAFVQGQAAHLELMHPEAAEPGRRDEIRAGLVRTWLRPAA